MDDYGQYIDIEQGLNHSLSTSIKNNHVSIDIDDTYITYAPPIDILPLAVHYLIYCIRRIFQ